MRFTLEERVIFSPSERCLTGADGSVAELTENNRRFLLLLLNGVTAKEKIINSVWQEQRGTISESSYYGQLYMLRNAFSRVGLKKSLIRTIPRKGVQYVGRFYPLPSGEVLTSGTTAQQSMKQAGCRQHRMVSTADIAVAPTTSVTNRCRWPLSRWQMLILVLMVLNLCWSALLSTRLLMTF